MRKYLIKGIAALALCAGFASCSKDDGDAWTQAKQDLAKYNNAFLTYIGGQISPDQTWGFSTSISSRLTRALSDYETYRGSLYPTVNGATYMFPSDCDASNFMAEVPDGVLSFAEVAGPNQNGYGSGVSYIDETWTDMVNIWGAWDGTQTVGGKLYVVGNNDFSNRQFLVCQNLDIYLVEGATLTLNDGAASTMKANIYISPGARLIAGGNIGLLKLDNGAKVYNHGEITAKSFEANNHSLLYNVGTVTTTGQMYVANSESVIVNDGTIISGTPTDKSGSLALGGSGRVQNNADWIVNGGTIVNSSDNIWVNNGHYTTEDFTYTATSSSVITNCYLTINENLNMNVTDGTGTFKIDAGGGVLTKNFNGGGPFTAKDNNNQDQTYNGGPYRIEMGSRSVFRVTGTARLNALSSASGYGFHAVGDDYAVFQAKNVVRDGDGHYNVTYSGNLYVSAENHFAQGYNGSYPYIVYANGCSEEHVFAPGFKSGKPAMTISATPCCPGFGNDTPSIQYDLRIIAEDLSAEDDTDFDFNDVVIDVKYDASNATICLQAAGGTQPLRIDGKDLFEVHKLFNVDTDYMVNTNAATMGLKGNYRGQEPVVFQLGRGINDAAEANSIKLEVFKNGVWQEMKAPKGEPASKLAVDTTYGWLDERTSIKLKYPTFVAWAEGTSFTSKWW